VQTAVCEMSINVNDTHSNATAQPNANEGMTAQQVMGPQGSTNVTFQEVIRRDFNIPANNVPVLGRENYMFWSKLMCRLMTINDCWYVVEDNIPKLEVGGLLANSAAQQLILQKIDAETFLDLSHLTTAHEMWEVLKEKFGSNSVSRKFELLNRLYTFEHRTAERKLRLW